jgi:hypothetical protein
VSPGREESLDNGIDTTVRKVYLDVISERGQHPLNLFPCQDHRKQLPSPGSNRFELWSAIHFRAEDAVFGDEILVAEPKLLVDRACNESKQFLPRYELSPYSIKI